MWQLNDFMDYWLYIGAWYGGYKFITEIGTGLIIEIFSMPKNIRRWYEDYQKRKVQKLRWKHQIDQNKKRAQKWKEQNEIYTREMQPKFDKAIINAKNRPDIEDKPEDSG